MKKIYEEQKNNYQKDFLFIDFEFQREYIGTWDAICFFFFFLRASLIGEANEELKINK